MLSKLKQLLGVSADLSHLNQARHQAMLDELGEPELIDSDKDTKHRIDVYAFARNFIEECSDEDDDEGFVLVTSGMSERLMALPTGYTDESAATELIWYVRELNPEYINMLRWLAKLPTIDHTWFGHGHTIPMPYPPLSFSSLSNFLLLPSIIRTDRELFSDIEHEGHSVATLCIHMLHEAEYRLVKSPDGLDEFLDLLDESDYPIIFNPQRDSLLE